PFLPLLLSAVSSATIMQLAKKDETNSDQIVEMLHQSSAVLTAIAFPVFGWLLFFGDSFIVTLFSPKYLDSVKVFQFSILVIPIRAYSYSTVLQYKRKGQLLLKGLLLDMLLALLLMYPLYQLFGLRGMALSMVIGTFSLAVFYLYHTAKILEKR